MKKLWVMALGTAFLLQTASLYAADIKFEGDFRVRGIYADDLDADSDTDDQQAFADGRFRLKTTATAGITSAVVTVDFTNSFNDRTNPFCPNGGVGSADSCATGNYRFGTANLGNSYNIFGVREAYLKLDLNLVKLAFGRKPFKLGHSLILDDTMDAVAAKFMAGPLDVLLANGKLVESNSLGTTGDTGDDTDIYIAKAGFNHGDMHNVGLFVAYLKDRGPSLGTTPFADPACTGPDPDGLGPLDPICLISDIGDDKADLWVLGVTADGKFGPIKLGVEADLLNGKIEGAGGDTDMKGLNVLVNGGIEVAMVDLGVTLLYTTGDDIEEDDLNVNGISGNFVLGNILVNDNINSDREGQCASIAGGRFGSGGRDCIGGTGITAIRVNAGLAGTPTKNCHTDVAAIWARTTEDFVAGADSDLGIEIDLNHRHKLDDNVAVAINLGYLFSGDAWKALGADPITGDEGPADNQVKGVISLNYMF